MVFNFDDDGDEHDHDDDNNYHHDDGDDRDDGDYHDDGDVDDDDGEGNSHGLQTPENSIKLVLNFDDHDVVDDDDKSDPFNQMNFTFFTRNRQCSFSVKLVSSVKMELYQHFFAFGLHLHWKLYNCAVHLHKYTNKACAVWRFKKIAWSAWKITL